MSLFWVKVVFALAVLGAGFAGALLPWALGGRGANERALAIGDTFAGGVLGGAGLVHLLADGAARFHATLPDVGYPLAFLLAGAGFMVILLIEGVIVAGHPEAGHGHGHSASQHEIGWPPRSETHRAIYPVILLIVLSVHSIILGVALGAQGTVAGALIVFLAIMAHKAMAGFALGVGYHRAGFGVRRAVPQVAFFSLMTPLAILAGTGVAVALSSHADALFEATFDSIGAGTFLYIATLDIIRTEFESPRDRWHKWFAACTGFGIMALLALWI